MSDTGFNRFEAALLERGLGPIRNGMARCPAHDDRNPSLRVSRGRDGALINCFAGCKPEAVVEALGLRLADLFDAPRNGHTNGHAPARIIETYIYTDENGTALFEVRRFEPKGFRQARIEPDGRRVTGPGCMKGVRMVPYHLADVIAAVAADDPIYVVEGEKDADRLRAEGCVATCNPGGAGKWKAEYGDFFENAADVRVIADRDAPGYRHAAQVAENLRAHGANVRVFKSVHGKDASDHLAAGGTLDELVEIDPAQKLDDYEEAPGSDPDASAAPQIEPTSAFFTDAGFVPSRLGELLKLQDHLAVGEDGELYRYRDGVYIPDGELHARSRVRDLLGEKFKKRHTDEVLAWLRADPRSISARPPVNLLNVRNGLLEWRTGEMRPHTPDHRSAIQIPIEWHPHACCPAIEAFLEDVLPDRDTVDFVLEIIGYALLADLALHTAVLLLGPGRNGKSVLLSIIRALLGAQNVASVPLQLFSESRFAAATLYGKLANICGDLDARAIERTDVFKMMTGGDPILAERKYGQPFAFTSFALPIFSANEAPYSKDQSEAWFERWLVIPMQRVIPAEKRDPHLTERLTAPGELEGLLVAAVEALRRLMERGRFDLPAAVRDAGRDYRQELDSVAGWIEDRCSLADPQAVTSRTALYASYQAWCEANGHRFPLRSEAVYKRLRANPSLQEITRRGNRGFRGVAVAAQ